MTDAKAIRTLEEENAALLNMLDRVMKREEINHAIVALILKLYKADKDHPVTVDGETVKQALKTLRVVVDHKEDGTQRLYYVDMEKSE